MAADHYTLASSILQPGYYRYYGEDDPPNHYLQQAILVYLSSQLKVQQRLQAASVQLVKTKRKQRNDDNDDDGDDEASEYNYDCYSSPVCSPAHRGVHYRCLCYL
jgi:hypothetical protein